MRCAEPAEEARTSSLQVGRHGEKPRLRAGPKQAQAGPAAMYVTGAPGCPPPDAWLARVSTAPQSPIKGILPATGASQTGSHAVRLTALPGQLQSMRLLHLQAGRAGGQLHAAGSSVALSACTCTAAPVMEESVVPSAAAASCCVSPSFPCKPEGRARQAAMATPARVLPQRLLSYCAACCWQGARWPGDQAGESGICCPCAVRKQTSQSGCHANSPRKTGTQCSTSS